MSIRPQSPIAHSLSVQNTPASVHEALSHVSPYHAVYRLLPCAAGIMCMNTGVFLDVNPAMCALHQKTHEELVGRTFDELNIFANPQQHLKLQAKLAQQGQVNNLYLLCQVREDVLPCNLSAVPVELSGHACMLFVFHDLHEQEQTYNELYALNRQLQQAGRLARLGAWEDRRGHGLVYWSEVCYDMHGLPRDCSLPRDYLNTFVAPRWRSMMRSKFQQCLRARTEWEIEIEIIRTDGQLLWVRTRGEAVLGEDGKVVAMRGVMQDIDDAKRAQWQLQQSEQRFERIFELVSTPMALLHADNGCIHMVNAAWEQLLDLTREEAEGCTLADLGICTPDSYQHLLMQARSHDPQGLDQYEHTLHTRRGRVLTVLQSMRHTAFDGEPFWLATMHDITHRKQQEALVQEREALLSLTLEAAALGRWDCDLRTGMLTGDATWHTLNALPYPETVDGVLAPSQLWHWSELFSSQDVPRYQAELLRHTQQPQDGPFDAIFRIQPVHAPHRWLRNIGKVVSHDAQGHAIRMLGVCLDVTAQQEQKHSLQQLAHFDPLTGLANRVELAARLQEARLQARQNGQLLGVVYLDLDGFKPVNDRLGHGAGDRLLVLVARRLQNALRNHDCVARLGGDEFVLLLTQLPSRAQCEKLLQRIMESIAHPYTIDGQGVQITASMGYTLYPEDDADEDALVRHADQAMYQAKQAGRNRFHAFDAALERAQRVHRAQGLRIREGLESGEFVLYLQPKIGMADNQLSGVEALARWQHPERGVLPPGEFLPLVEGSDLEILFDRWALCAALASIGQLLGQGMQVAIAVNISARHLQQPGFAQWVTAQLQAHPHIPSHLLELEITESAALYDVVHVAEVLTELRNLGVGVSLDDFGTGYSSLTYLRSLPLDTLKIDRSFVRDMLNDAGDCAIIQSVTGLARSLGYNVVAEGVETQEQWQMLKRMGCTHAQGFFFARPMPLEGLGPWLQQWKSTQTSRSTNTQNYQI